MATYMSSEQDTEKPISTNDQFVRLFPWNEIGRGMYGAVYAAVYYGVECVAKEMYQFVVAQVKEMSQAAFSKEVEMLEAFKHPNIVQLLTVCHRTDTPDLPILVMEKMAITLTTFLIRERPLHHKIYILHGIVCGLLYLHNKCKIIHRNLTANNILLSDEPKISDFGTAKVFDPSKQLTNSPGDLSHMPPEARSKDNPRYTFKLDIFSFGCVIVNTATQEQPIPTFEEHKELPNGQYLLLSEVERRSEFIDKMAVPELQHLHSIVLRCLKNNPDERPDTLELLPLFQKILENTPGSTKHTQPRFTLMDELDIAQSKMATVQEKISNMQIEKDELDSCKVDLEQRVKDQQDKIHNQQDEIQRLKEETTTLGSIYGKEMEGN